MKKVGVIVLAAAMLTVGGVYATFNYAQGEALAQKADLSYSIAAKTTNSAKGTITVTTDFTFNIDDANGDLVVDYTTAGTTKVNFTAAKGADAIVETYGTPLKLEVLIEGPNDNGKGFPIYSTTPEYTAGGVALKNGSPITGDYTVDVSKYVKVNAYSLPAASDYDQYVAGLKATTVSIKISEI